MSKTEFVRLSSPEKDFGEKNLLQSQLELLDLLQRFQKYKELRNEELVLKVTLKTKVEEALSFIDKLEKLLPKSTLKELTPEDKAKARAKIEKALTLEEEIDRIRNKLMKLRG
jgi:hypothetical protein